LKVYDKAVQLLAARPHFRRELEAKLRQRGFPSEEIEDALARLTDQGYLDDRAAARSFVESRAAKGEGRARLRAELVKRGAPEEAIEEALSELTGEDDLPRAREAAEAWRRRGGTDPRALARHLDRKGFSRRAIVAVLNGEGLNGELDLEDEP
jgi:regulatory protein